MSLMKKLRNLATAGLASLALLMPQPAQAASGLERSVEAWADGKAGEKIASYASTLGINMVTCSLVRGFEAKKHGKKFLTGFSEGLWHGAVAGSLESIGMEIASYNARYKGMGAVGRIIFNAGTSVALNSMDGRDPFSRYEIDIGPLLISYDFAKGKKGFNVYGDLMSTAAIIKEFALKHRWHPELLLYDFTFAFSFEDSTRSPFISGSVYGYTGANIPTFSRAYPITRSHENIHTLQYAHLRVFDSINFLDHFRTIHLTLGSNVANFHMFSTIVPLYLISDVFYDYNPLEWQAFALERE